MSFEETRLMRRHFHSEHSRSNRFKDDLYPLEPRESNAGSLAATATSEVDLSKATSREWR